MTDKRSTQQPDITPKRPPKQSARDYSALPQRPITLKRLDKKKTPHVTKQSNIKSKPPTTHKKKVTPKPTTPRAKERPVDQWVLKGISDEAKQYALNEANSLGITISEWIEQMILSHQQPVASEPEPREASFSDEEDPIKETLQAIEERLERIEQQRGFWDRFWDFAMNQNER